MNLFIQSLVAVVVFLICCLGCGSLLAYWIARGEADVNGDPERDGGLLPTKATTLRVICSECKITIKPGSEPVSHGYCPKCAAAFIAQCDEYFKNASPRNT